MKNSEMNLGQLVKTGAGQPYQLRLDLSQVVTDMEFNLAGRVIAVWNAPTSAEYILVRFNRRDADQIQFSRGKVLAAPFTKLYVTTPAGQVGNFDILYGPNAFEILRIYPNPPQNDTVFADILTQLTAILAEELLRGITDDTMLTRLTGILDEQQGPQAEIGFGQTAVGVAAVQIMTSNPLRHGGIIQAPSTNGANFIYLGFDNTVAANNCFAELAAGSSWSFDAWRGDVYAIASLAAQVVNYGEW